MAAQEQWDQVIADVGWELLYREIPLIDGAIDLADLSQLVTRLEDDGWTLILIGHLPDGTTQLCLRRAQPGRDEHIRQIQLLRDHLQGRNN